MVRLAPLPAGRHDRASACGSKGEDPNVYARCRATETLRSHQGRIGVARAGVCDAPRAQRQQLSLPCDPDAPAPSAESPGPPLFATAACSTRRAVTPAAAFTAGVSPAATQPSGSSRDDSAAIGAGRPGVRRQGEPARLGPRRSEPRSHRAAGEGPERRRNDRAGRNGGRPVEGQRPVQVGGMRRPGICPVCGARFDPSRYQVLVSAVGDAPFDRVECADVALADQRRAQAERLARRARRRRAG